MTPGAAIGKPEPCRERPASSRPPGGMHSRQVSCYSIPYAGCALGGGACSRLQASMAPKEDSMGKQKAWHPLAAASVLLAACGGAAPTSSLAQDYYAGKTITFLVGGNAGGGYDVYARAIARHITRHIGGTPLVVVRNQPGAGSGTAAATIYNTAPKDGTWVGVLFPGVIMGPIVDPQSRLTFAPA